MTTTDSRIRGRPFKRVGGLVFFPNKEQRGMLEKGGLKVYAGIEAWMKANFPDNAIVHDYAGTLVDANFPLLDAVFRHGVYHRLHAINKAKGSILYPIRPIAKEVTRFSKFTLPIIAQDTVLMVEPDVSKASSGHGKMVRGAANRKPKK